MPGHDRDVVACEELQQVAAGETAGAGDENRGRHERVLPGHSTERAVERREVPQPGEREGHEEAVVRGDRRVAERTPIDRLILERDAAALRVVEPRQTLLQHTLVENV